MAGFADELGQLAANAIHQKERTYELEKASLAAKMWGEWAGRAGIRERAKIVASKGNKYYDFKFDTKQYGFKEFKPKKEDIVANLPHPLKLEWDANRLQVSHGMRSPDYLEFECCLRFDNETEKHLEHINKREAGEVDAEDAAIPAPKRVKSEVKSEVKAEPP